MKTLWITVIALAGLTASSTAQQCQPVEQVCRNIKVQLSDSIPGSPGPWYLYATTPTISTYHGHCGLFRALSPCACVGGNMKVIPGSSLAGFPTFALNRDTNKFTEPADNLQVGVVPTCNDYAVYNITSVDGRTPNFIPGRIGTNSGQSYFVYYICSVDIKGCDSSPMIWFFSTTPVAKPQDIETVKGILAENNISYDILQRVDHTNCPYSS